MRAKRFLGFFGLVLLMFVIGGAGCSTGSPDQTPALGVVLEIADAVIGLPGQTTLTVRITEGWDPLTEPDKQLHLGLVRDDQYSRVRVSYDATDLFTDGDPDKLDPSRFVDVDGVYELVLQVDAADYGNVDFIAYTPAPEDFQFGDAQGNPVRLVIGMGVISPNGGEAWPAGLLGQRPTIEWLSEGVAWVDIELSLDGNWVNGDGSDVVTIASPVDATLGSYEWQLGPEPEHVDDECLVRVRDVTVGGPSDISDDFFRITIGTEMELYLGPQLEPEFVFDDWPEDPVRGTLRSAKYMLPPGGDPSIEYNKIYFRIPNIPPGIDAARLQVVVESESSVEALGEKEVILSPADLQLVGSNLEIAAGGEGITLRVVTSQILRQILVVEEELLKFTLQYDSTGFGNWVWANDIDVMVDLAEACPLSVYDCELSGIFAAVSSAFRNGFVSNARMLSVSGFKQTAPTLVQEQQFAEALSSFGCWWDGPELVMAEVDFLLSVSHGKQAGKFYGLESDGLAPVFATNFLPVTLDQEEEEGDWGDSETDAEYYWGAGNYDDLNHHPRNVWAQDADWLISTACYTLYGEVGWDKALSRWIRALQGYSDDGTGRCPHGILGFAGVSIYESWFPVHRYNTVETLWEFDEYNREFDPGPPVEDTYTIVDAWVKACQVTGNPNYGWVCHWDEEEGNTLDNIYDPSLDRPIYMTPDFAPGHNLWRATHSSVSTSVGAVAGGAPTSPEALPRLLVVESAVDGDVVGCVQQEAGVRISATDRGLFSGRRRAEARSEALALDDARRAVSDIEGHLRAHHDAELGAVWVTKEGIGTLSSLAGNMRPVDYGFRFRHLHKGVPVADDFLHIRVDAGGVASVSGRWRCLKEHESGKGGLTVNKDEAIRVARKLRSRVKAEATRAEGAKASLCYVPVTTRAGELALKWRVEFDDSRFPVYVDEETVIEVEGE